MHPVLIAMLILLAVPVWALLFEANLWQLYGIFTYRTFGLVKIPFFLALLLGFVLFLVDVILPWVLLFTNGAQVTLIALLAVPLATMPMIFLLGWIIEQLPSLFIRQDLQRKNLMDEAAKRLRVYRTTLDHWAEMDAEARDKFVHRADGLVIHIREALFAGLLTEWPIVDPATLPDMKNSREFALFEVQKWGGAHLYHHLAALLDMKAGINGDKHWLGHLPGASRHPNHPEACGEVLFARVAEDRFVIAPAS